MSFQGSLEDISLASIIQLNCLERCTGRVTLESQGVRGFVYIQEGEVVHARVENSEGPDAIYRLLSWKKGVFEFEKDQSTPKRTIHLPWNTLLLEGMVRIDTAKKEQSEKFGEALVHIGKLPGVKEVFVETREGKILTAETHVGVTKQAAVVSFLMKRGESIGHRLDMGPWREMLFTTAGEKIRVTPWGDEAMLTLILQPHVSVPSVVAGVEKILADHCRSS